MKMKDVLLKAAAILGFEGDGTGTTKEEKKLLDCANTVYEELTTEYVPLKDRATVAFEGGRCYYDSFPKTVRDIVAVYIRGTKTPFQMYPQYLYAEGADDLAEVLYLYRDGKKDVEDELNLPPQFSASVAAAGACAEYCYRTGLIDEGIFYKNRYDQSVYNLTKTMKRATLPSRRFL